MRICKSAKGYPIGHLRALDVLSVIRDAVHLFLGDRMLKFVLYGSYARGDYSQDSDIDVAIIIRDLDSRLKDQILNIIAEIELNHAVPVSALVMSEKDFQLLKKRERRLAADIEREGIPV